MIKYLINFDTNTGEIIATFFAYHDPEIDVLENDKLEVNKEDLFDDISEYKYIDISGSPQLIDRPQLACSINTTNIVADGVDSATISSIPNPSIVIIYDINTLNGEELEIIDGNLSITSSEPQTIKVIVKTTNPFPEKDYEIEIIAV